MCKSPVRTSKCYPLRKKSDLDRAPNMTYVYSGETQELTIHTRWKSNFWFDKFCVFQGAKFLTNSSENIMRNH